MKKPFILAVLTIVAVAGAQAQPRQAGGSPGLRFDATLAKLFGDNQSFSAQLEFAMPDPSSANTMTMPGKIFFDAGKSRFEINFSDIKGSRMPPGIGDQMKARGMDTVVSISRPDKKVANIIYPGIQSYLEAPLTDKNETAPPADLKSDVTALGTETVDGHDCVKNKVIVTDADGQKHESTVWNAKDLKNFPVKIESTGQGRTTVMTFKNVSFEKPDAGVFETPASFTKYSSPQELMQAVAMKQLGNTGIMGRPPGQ